MNNHFHPKTQKEYKEMVAQIIKELENKAIEREELIRILVLAIFSRTNIFLIGPPGVGKTYILNILLKSMPEAKSFEYLVMAHTKPEELFGTSYVDENGNIVANTNAEDWVRGMALASNSTMDRATIGGIRFNNQFNASDGTVATNADASTTDKSGTHIDTSNSTKTGTDAKVPDGFMQRAWEEINEEHPNAPLSEKMQMLSQRMAQFEKNKSYANLKQNTIFELGEVGAGAVAALEGIGIYNAVEGVTKGKVQLDPEKLQKDGAVKYTAEDIENNPELRKQGIKEPGFYKDGKRVATLEGFATDPETGRVMEKGIINRTARKAWDKLESGFDKLVGGEPSSQTFDNTTNSTTNTANDGSTDNKQTNPKENIHNNPPSNKDTNIVNDAEEKVKGSGSGLVGDAEKAGRKGFIKTLGNVANKVLSHPAVGAIATVVDGLAIADTVATVGDAASAHEDGIPYSLIFGGPEKVTPSLIKEAQELRAEKFGRNNPVYNIHDNPIERGYNEFIKDNKIDTDKYSVFVSYENGELSFSAVSNESIKENNYLHKRAMETLTGKDIPQPTVSTPTSNPDWRDSINTQPVSTAAAQAISQQPSSGADYHTAITNQVEQARATNYIQQAMTNLKDITHPIAPAPGVTIPTMGGNLSIGTSNNGNLQIGDYETRVPMTEFRNFMNNNPQGYQAFAQTIATSPFNNDNIQERFGSSYDKKDNGTMEHLLSDMTYYTRTSTKDNQIGLGGILDMQERMIEILEEQKEALKTDEK